MSEFVLARGGRVCRICLAPQAPQTAATAAGELARCLKAQCGTAPEMYCGTPQAGELCLGARSGDCEKEELRLCVEEGILWLDGGERGLIYAAYELLERLGCRFFTADCEYLPTAEELTLPEDTHVVQKPLFEYRSAYWYGVDAAFAPKLRLNAVKDDPISEKWGGDVHYNGFVHTLGDLAEMEKVDGDYLDRQPCLTSEKTFETVVKNLRGRLREDPSAAIASVSQNDSHEYGRGCGCSACRALDEAEGTPMGSLLTFVNRVADTLKPEYPALAIDTLAYRYTRKAPAVLCARDNVIVRLCSIECCFSHPIAECDTAIYAVEDESFAATLRSWAKHCGRIYIWDYTTNFRNYHVSYPNFGVLRQNLRFFAENHVRGVFEQGDRQTVNGEFGLLRAYLLGKLLWDPYMSEETYLRHMDEFLTGYYGAGGPALRRFIDRLQAAAARVHFGIYFEDPTTLFTDPGRETIDLAGAEAFLQKGREDFAQARAVATPVQRTRLERAELQLDVYEWYLRRAQMEALPEEADDARAAARTAVQAAGEVLYAHALAHGITYMHESFASGDYRFDNGGVDFLQQPAFWGK